MIPGHKRFPAIEEITISDSSDDEEEVIILPSNNGKINKENTPRKQGTEKSIDSLTDIHDNVTNKSKNSFENSVEETKEEEFGDELYSLDDRHNGDFIICDMQPDSDCEELDSENSNVRDNKMSIDDSDRNISNEYHRSNEDSDEERFYIADDVDPLENNNPSVSDAKITNYNDKLNERLTNKEEQSINKSLNKEEIEIDDEMCLDLVSDDESKERNVEIITIPESYRGSRLLMKKLMKFFCNNCNSSTRNNWRRGSQAGCYVCGETLTCICRACNTEASSILKLTYHLRSCQPHMFYSCLKCKYTASSEQTLEAHVKRQHENEENESQKVEKSMRCSKCLKIFKKKHNLKVHEERWCKKKMKNPYKKRKKEAKIVPVEPKIIEENTNLDDYIKLHCCKCNLIFEKGKLEKKCDKCEAPLLWQCLKCKTKSKSYCGIYAHAANCTSEFTQLILV